MVNRTKYNKIIISGYRPYVSRWFRRHQTEGDFLKLFGPTVSLPDSPNAAYTNISIPDVIFLKRDFNRYGADQIIPVRLTITVWFGVPFTP